MTPLRVVLTAGYDRAPHVATLAERLRRQGTIVAGLLVISPFNLARLRELLRQRGFAFLRTALPRLLGRTSPASDVQATQGEGPVLVAHSLRVWARRHGVPHRVVKSFDAPEARLFVSESAPDWVVYGGGGILPPAFIDAAGGHILNAHAGPLPAIRGMNAIEWSLLLDYDPTVTVHVIDRGIDTGAALTWHPVPVQPGDTIEKLRMRSVAIGVEALFQILQHPPASVGSAEPATQRQCFVLAPALRELLERRLSEGRYPPAPLVTPGVHGAG